MRRTHYDNSENNSFLNFSSATPNPVMNHTF